MRPVIALNSRKTRDSIPRIVWTEESMEPDKKKTRRKHFFWNERLKCTKSCRANRNSVCPGNSTLPWVRDLYSSAQSPSTISSLYSFLSYFNFHITQSRQICYDLGALHLALKYLQPTPNQSAHISDSTAKGMTTRHRWYLSLSY